jgi:hypothetical protein
VRLCIVLAHRLGKHYDCLPDISGDAADALNFCIKNGLRPRLVCAARNGHMEAVHYPALALIAEIVFANYPRQKAAQVIYLRVRHFLRLIVLVSI